MSAAVRLDHPRYHEHNTVVPSRTIKKLVPARHEQHAQAPALVSKAKVRTSVIGLKTWLERAIGRGHAMYKDTAIESGSDVPYMRLHKL